MPFWDDRNILGLVILSLSQPFSQLPSVPQLCGAWYQSQAPEKGGQNSEPTSWTHWFCGITVPAHGNKVEPWPQNPDRRETKAPGSYTPVSSTYRKTR